MLFVTYRYILSQYINTHIKFNLVKATPKINGKISSVQTSSRLQKTVKVLAYVTSMTLGGALTNLPVEVVEHMSKLMLTRVPEWVESLLEVSYCIGSAIGCFLNPVISKRLGYARSLFILFLCSAIGTVLTPVPLHWSYTVIIRILTGLCASSCASITPLVVAEQLDPEQRGYTMMVYSVCLNIGVLMSYLSNYLASFNYNFYYLTYLPALTTSICGAAMSRRLERLQNRPRRLPPRAQIEDEDSDDSSSDIGGHFGVPQDRSDTFVRTVDEESTQAFEERASRFTKRRGIQQKDPKSKRFRVGSRHGNIYLGRQYSVADSDRELTQASNFNPLQNKSKRNSILHSQFSYYQSTNDSVDTSEVAYKGGIPKSDVKQVKTKAKKRLFRQKVPLKSQNLPRSLLLQSINENGLVDAPIDVAVTDSGDVSTLWNTVAHQEQENVNLSMKLTKSQYARLCYVACALGAMQMLTGVDAVAIFASDIFGGLFPRLQNSGALGALVLGACNIVFTVMAASFVERIPRRAALLAGVLGCGGCTAAAAAATACNGPQWLILALLLGFNAFYAAGPEPVVFMLLSEIFPAKYKDRLNAAAYAVDWVSNIASVFLFGLASSYGLQWVAYAGFSVFTIVLGVSATLLAPETFRRSLIDIEREIRGWTRKRRHRRKAAERTQINEVKETY